MRFLRLDAVVMAGACALALLAAPGCAGTQSVEGKRRVVVCEDKPITGSLIGRTHCYSKTQMDERGESDREQIRRATLPKSIPLPSEQTTGRQPR